MKILFTLLKKYNLKKEVKLLGSMPYNEVRDYMEKSQIHIATSDFNEGLIDLKLDIDLLKVFSSFFNIIDFNNSIIFIINLISLLLHS